MQPSRAELETANRQPFSPGLAKCLDRSIAHSRRLLNGFISTQHLLLGILTNDEPDPALQILIDLGINPAKTIPEIETEAEKTTWTTFPREQILANNTFFLSLRGERVLQLAANESRIDGASEITTTHLLLALFREEQGVAARVLGNQGVSLEQIREKISQTKVTSTIS